MEIKEKKEKEKQEIIKGSPVKYCLGCGRKKWSCRCYRVSGFEELRNVKKDACYHKVKRRFKVFPSAYAGGAIAKCRKVGAANYGNKTKKKDGGLLNAIKEVKNKQEMIKASNGKAYRKRKTNKKNVARGCGQVLNERRKVTKYR